MAAPLKMAAEDQLIRAGTLPDIRYQHHPDPQAWRLYTNIILKDISL